MTVLITLTTAGTSTGPFNLYSNLDGFTSAFEIGVTKGALLAGYSSSLVPDGTSIIRVKSAGVCQNYIDIVLTTTTTSTLFPPSTTTTSTTTEAPPVTCSAYTIENQSGTPIIWSGAYCISGNSVGGTVLPGQTFSTPCLVDGSFASGSAPGVTITTTPC